MLQQGILPYLIAKMRIILLPLVTHRFIVMFSRQVVIRPSAQSLCILRLQPPILLLVFRR